MSDVKLKDIERSTLRTDYLLLRFDRAVSDDNIHTIREAIE